MPTGIETHERMFKLRMVPSPGQGSKKMMPGLGDNEGDFTVGLFCVTVMGRMFRSVVS